MENNDLLNREVQLHPVLCPTQSNIQYYGSFPYCRGYSVLVIAWAMGNNSDVHNTYRGIVSNDIVQLCGDVHGSELGRRIKEEFCDYRRNVGHYDSRVDVNLPHDQVALRNAIAGET